MPTPPPITSPPSVPLWAAAEGGGSGPSQEGVHLGLGFNEGGRPSAVGWFWGFREVTLGLF